MPECWDSMPREGARFPDRIESSLPDCGASTRGQGMGDGPATRQDRFVGTVEVE